MATPEEESRKLLCVCGKHHGTFTMQGLDIVCRHCKETTTVPYRIKNLQEGKHSCRNAEAWRVAPRPGCRTSQSVDARVYERVDIDG